MFIYDYEGRKRHFVEPDTLRNMSHYYNFLVAMDDLISDDFDDSAEAHIKFIVRFDINIKRSMDDILFRYANENLPAKERSMFIHYSEEDIRRRGKIIVYDLLKRLENDKGNYGYNRTKLYKNFAKDYSEYEYSYGELMRALYIMGRTEIYDKKFVHALLAMYNNVLTKIFYRYREYKFLYFNHKDATENEKREYFNNKNNNYSALKEVMSNSIVGSWALYLMPNIGNFDAHKPSGVASNVKLCKVCFNFEPIGPALDNIIAMKNNRNLNKAKFITNVANLADDLKECIIMLMFFSNFKTVTGYNDKYTIVYNKKDKRYMIENSMADYNILNFINNTFIFDEFYNNFLEAILDLIRLNISDKEMVKNISVDMIKDKSRNNSFYKRMVNWINKYGGMIIPVYATDVYYNMIKRLVNSFNKSMKPIIEKDELFDTFISLIDCIREKLLNLESYYNHDKRPIFKETYSQIYKECPLIDFFEKKNKDEKFKQMFGDIISSAIYCREN